MRPPAYQSAELCATAVSALVIRLLAAMRGVRDASAAQPVAPVE
jgi:hypothetical protein